MHMGKVKKMHIKEQKKSPLMNKTPMEILHAICQKHDIKEQTSKLNATQDFEYQRWCQNMIPKINQRKDKEFLTWGAVQRED